MIELSEDFACYVRHFHGLSFTFDEVASECSCEKWRVVANQILVDDILDIIRRGRDDDGDKRWRSTVGEKVVSFNVPEQDNSIVSDWISRLKTDLNETVFFIFPGFVDGSFALMIVVWSSTRSSCAIICGAEKSRRDLLDL